MGLHQTGTGQFQATYVAFGRFGLVNSSNVLLHSPAILERSRTMQTLSNHRGVHDGNFLFRFFAEHTLTGSVVDETPMQTELCSAIWAQYMIAVVHLFDVFIVRLFFVSSIVCA